MSNVCMDGNAERAHVVRNARFGALSVRCRTEVFSYSVEQRASHRDALLFAHRAVIDHRAVMHYGNYQMWMPQSVICNDVSFAALVLGHRRNGGLGAG